MMKGNFCYFICLHSIWVSYPDVALRLQERIKTALVSYTEIEVQTIDVVVQDIILMI